MTPTQLDERIERLVDSVFAARDRRPIYEWAHDHVTLPKSYVVPGPFSVAHTRPLMQIFHDIADPRVREVWFTASVQFGKTMAADISIPWIICNDPGPIMQILQTDEDAKTHFKMRTRPLWRACPPVMARMPANRHDTTSTETHFGDFSVLYCGPTDSNLQGKSIRWLFVDEAWMPHVGKMMGQARGRITAYEDKGFSKLVVTSQAGVDGDAMDQGMRSGNMCVWCYRAGNGKLVPLLMGPTKREEEGQRWGLVWADDAKRPDGTINEARAAETAHYVCRETGEQFADEPRTRHRWNEDGDWLAQRPDAPRSVRSYTVNALVNRPLSMLAKQKALAINAMMAGNMQPMIEFVQKREARPWQDRREQVELVVSKSGYTVADYAAGQRWEMETDRGCFIDRQQGREGDVPHWWVHVVAFCSAGAMRTLYFGRCNTIDEVREIQQRYGVRDRATWQDAGFQSPLVYDDCARFGWLATFGDGVRNGWQHKSGKNPDGSDRIVVRPWSPPQQTRSPSGRVVTFFHWSSNYAKDILSRLVSGQGVQFELPDDLPTDIAAQLKAEHRVQMPNGKWRWEKLHAKRDNHMWDTSAQAIIYALLRGFLVGAEVSSTD